MLPRKTSNLETTLNHLLVNQFDSFICQSTIIRFERPTYQTFTNIESLSSVCADFVTASVGEFTLFVDSKMRNTSVKERGECCSVQKAIYLAYSMVLEKLLVLLFSPRSCSLSLLLYE